MQVNKALSNILFQVYCKTLNCRYELVRNRLMGYVDTFLTPGRKPRGKGTRAGL